VVTKTTGKLTQGHILVSNFNNSANLQGTGTTIVDVAPNGAVNLFAEINASSLPGACPGGVGLTAALVFLRAGWVVVGSLPTTDGTAATAQAGCLLVLDSSGNVVETITDTLINGPWDMTALDLGTSAALFLANVLNGTVAGGGNVVNQGTVLRINLALSTTMPVVQSIAMIGSRFPERTDPAALVIGPTGVGLARSGTLYVADSLSNRIAAIPNAVTRMSTAGTGLTVSAGGALSDPLGLAVAPGQGNILTTNGNNGLLVVTSLDGSQGTRILLDHTGTPPGAGTLFGLAVAAQGVFFVDDGSNTLNQLTATGQN
jgi:DNA-binding beta-propeller fold protein YncE